MLRTLLAVATAVVVLALPMGAFAMYGPAGGTAPATTSASSGFDYHDAGIGAAVGALALVLVGGAVFVARHHGGHIPAGTRA